MNLDTYFAASMFHKLFLTALACIVTVNVVPGFQSAVTFYKSLLPLIALAMAFEVPLGNCDGYFVVVWPGG